MLCNLEELDMNPSIWSQDTMDEFKAQTGKSPDFLLKDAENRTRYSNIRPYLPDPKKKTSFAFQERLKQNPTYDAFKNDIAMVNFYFERGNVMQLSRDLKMTEFDFVSQVGGMFGLGLGFSLISGAEIIYWMTIRLWQNLSGGCSMSKNVKVK